jgi:hypothetical protein
MCCKKRVNTHSIEKETNKNKFTAGSTPQKDTFSWVTNKKRTSKSRFFFSSSVSHYFSNGRNSRCSSDFLNFAAVHFKNFKSWI